MSLVKDMGFCMRADHPIAWYRDIGEGKAFYSALGHNAGAFEAEGHRQLLEAAMTWGMK